MVLLAAGLALGGLFGGNKQAIKQELGIDVINKKVTEQISRNSQKAAATGQNLNKLKLSIDTSIGCKITTAQTIDSEVVSTGEINTETLTEIQKEVSTDLQQSTNAILEKVTGFLSTEFGSDSKVEQVFNNRIENISKDVFKTENYNEVRANAVNINEGEIEIGYVDCTTGGEVDVSQDISSRVIAEALMDEVVDRMITDKTLNAITASMAADLKVESSGPFESLGNMLFGSTTAMIGVVLCCLISLSAFFGLLYFMMKSDGGSGGSGGSVGSVGSVGSGGSGGFGALVAANPKVIAARAAAQRLVK